MAGPSAMVEEIWRCFQRFRVSALVGGTVGWGEHIGGTLVVAAAAATAWVARGGGGRLSWGEGCLWKVVRGDGVAIVVGRLVVLWL